MSVILIIKKQRHLKRTSKLWFYTCKLRGFTCLRCFKELFISTAWIKRAKFEWVMSSYKRVSECGDICVFCDCESNGSDTKLCSPSQVGRDKILKVLPVLRKKKTARRLSDSLGVLEENQSGIRYHKNCYRVFIREHDFDDTRNSNDTGRQAIDLTSCIFCQEKTKQDLHAVKSPEMAQKISWACETHPFMARRIPPYMDSVATGIKYHNRCYVTFLRESWNTALESGAPRPPPSSEDALQLLADELLADTDRRELHATSAFTRYQEICGQLGVLVPNSFMSRTKTFLSALQPKLGEAFDFKAVRGAGTTLTAVNGSDKTEDQEEDVTQDLARLARAIQEEIKNTPSYEGLQGDKESALSSVPSLLLSFLRQLLDVGAGGDGDGGGAERCALSIAQDIVYCTSRGRRWTPKHVGLANTIHQETRSKRLVDMLHNAGHCLSYKQLLTVTTGLAEAVLSSADESTGAVVPPNLVPGKFVHFAVDNIDILDESLDGKNTFHATQVRF